MTEAQLLHILAAIARAEVDGRRLAKELGERILHALMTGGHDVIH